MAITGRAPKSSDHVTLRKIRLVNIFPIFQIETSEGEDKLKDVKGDPVKDLLTGIKFKIAFNCRRQENRQELKYIPSINGVESLLRTKEIENVDGLTDVRIYFGHKGHDDFRGNYELHDVLVTSSDIKPVSV